MEYRIVIAGQGRQHVERVTAPYQSETVAVCLNSKHGWIAYRADDPAAEEHRFESPAAGVNVSRMVNQHGGGAMIVEALGL